MKHLNQRNQADEVETRGFDLELLKRILQLMLPHKGKVLLALVGLGLSAAGALLLPLILQKAVDGPLTHPGPLAGQALSQAGFFYLGTLIVTMLASFLQIFLLTWVGQNVMMNLRSRLMNHFLEQKAAWLQTRPVGRLVSALTGDVGTLSEFYNTLFTSLLKDLVVMVGAVVALFALHPGLATWTTLTLIPALGMITVFRWKSRKAYRKTRGAVAKVNTFLNEYLGGMSLVQLFTRETRAREDFRKENQALLKANLGELYVNALFRPLIDLFFSISLGTILFLGAGLVGQGAVSLGILMAFIGLLNQFYQPLGSLAENFANLQSALAGSERVFSFLEDKQTVPDQGQENLSTRNDLSVEFRNVHFAYNPQEPVLRGLSFQVRPGQTVALVGYTGAGKTTVTSLLTRFWDPDEGHILLDGKDLRDYRLESLRTRVQSVLQDVNLFSGSLKENITLGKSVPQETLDQVAAAVCLDKVLTHLPQGWETPLGEGAYQLSAGQKQLVSFARTLIQNPGVLILDEATSHIDTETEHLVQLALQSLLKGRTSLVIAHRLSTIRHADRILVLDQGRVLEEGTHEKLLESRGFYYNLYKLQYEIREN